MRNHVINTSTEAAMAKEIKELEGELRATQFSLDMATARNAHVRYLERKVQWYRRRMEAIRNFDLENPEPFFDPRYPQ